MIGVSTPKQERRGRCPVGGVPASEVDGVPGTMLFDLDLMSLN